MRLRHLFTPSFRNRLRLFFVVIVIIPMIAVALVLFQLVSRSEQSQTDAQLSLAQRVAQNLYRESADRADAAGRAMVADEGLQRAIADRPATVQQRLAAAARAAGARRVLLELQDQGTFEVGAQPGVAPAANALTDPQGQPLGRLVTAVDTAGTFASELERTSEVGVLVLQGRETLAASRPELERAALPASGSVEIDGTDYRVSTLRLGGFDGGPLAIRLTLPETAGGSTPAWIVVGAVLGFLVLALAFAATVSRTLQAEIQSLLEAARAIGRGDFSVEVPTEGNDEFAALGKEFNSMARQLEGRLEELQLERARLQETVRRVGESLGKGLDRDALLGIVVRTAVDGVGADCGRVVMRQGANGRLSEAARAGNVSSYMAAVQAAEAAALEGGEAAETQISGANALARPLRAPEPENGVLGVISIARPGRPFTERQRELFAYLTNQAAISIENVDLHEAIQRQAVTDELTGLFNHRRFQEVMAAEVERTRRFGQELGLIMLDMDDFKRVNDTYGHLQGDFVLREVARVLRESSREIDEPARYGGEEMAVALPQTGLQGAFEFAERVRQRIEVLQLPLLDGDGTLRVTASFGAASLPHSAKVDKDALISAADAALYRAKRSGKNRTVKAE